MLTRFSYSPLTAGEHTVGLCGDFAGWRIIDMKNERGVYRAELDLAPGSYLYKLVVDGEWIADPANPDKIADPFGGHNSRIRVGAGEQVCSTQKKIHKDFDVPRWVQEGIVYQIFPDRFCNGDPGNDPDFSEQYYDNCKTPPPKGEFLKAQHEYFHLVSDWNDVSDLTQSKYLPEGKPDWWTFYGGDLRGVISKLDYLRDLGVTILYFNPLWKAKSNHKYDSADFMSIDPHFGTVEEMRELVSKAHSYGMRIIVDVAFNHTGETFWAFEDCIQKGMDSEWWDWYDWFKWPLPDPLPEDFHPKEYYQCWWGIKDMPDLNYDLARPHPYENEVKDIAQATPNMTLVAHLLHVVRWWIGEIDIDGFRLDVPDEVPFWFWELFHNEVKRIKADAWLVGEIWNDASEWVNDKYFDSVMNYAYFMAPAHDLFLHRSIDCEEFTRRIEEGLRAYPESPLKAMMNLIGSHDTWRVRELCRDDLNRLMLLLVFQYTFIGTPHIYYGDEIGMHGKGDPDNRRPFDWDWERNETAQILRREYQTLIRLRREHPELVDGEIAFDHSKPELLCYTRTLGKSVSMVCINLGPEDEHRVFTELLPIYQVGKGLISQGREYRIAPQSAVVFFGVKS